MQRTTGCRSDASTRGRGYVGADPLASGGATSLSPTGGGTFLSPVFFFLAVRLGDQEAYSGDYRPPYPP